MSDKPRAIRPFLRWAGGKQWLSRYLVQLIPEGVGTYYEPFLGGGSLYFAALPPQAVLSDLNPRLVEVYEELRDRPQELIGVLKLWANDKQTYYRIRSANFRDKTFRVAQFIYLNRTCWNGLYRVNRQGRFNVPFGHNGRAVADEEQLLQNSNALRNIELQCGDFEEILIRAKKGDFVYMDPPYTALHENNGFRQYNERLFSWEDQMRLGRVAVDLSEKGCHVVVSNANRDEILQLYPGFCHKQISRHSVLAASPKYRRVTAELLIASGPSLLEPSNRRD